MTWKYFDMLVNRVVKILYCFFFFYSLCNQRWTYLETYVSNYMKTCMASCNRTVSLRVLSYM